MTSRRGAPKAPVQRPYGICTAPVQPPSRHRPDIGGLCPPEAKAVPVRRDAPIRAGRRGAFPDPPGPGRGTSRGHAKAPQHPRRGPQRPSASARPSHGGRSAPAGSGTGLCHQSGTGLREPFPHGRGNAVRFRVRPPPPALAEAIAEVMRRRLPYSRRGPPRPSARACRVGHWSLSAMRHRSYRSVPTWAGKRGAFPDPPGPGRTLRHPR